MKPVTKAKVINLLYRVSLQRTCYTGNYKKKGGAALVRTITSKYIFTLSLVGCLKSP